jgi:hypothetical protein
MIIQIFFNTIGFLGGWANPPSIQEVKVIPITQAKINEAKVKNIPLYVDFSNQEMMIFSGAIIGRDNIEILPLNTKKYDIEIGNIKLKFPQNQDTILLKNAYEAHTLTFTKDNHKLNEDEKMIKELYKTDKVIKKIIKTKKLKGSKKKNN